MKTTVNIPDELFLAAKTAAISRRTTLTALVEEGLRSVINETRRPVRAKFRLADGSFKGEAGLQPGVDLSDWARIREMTYEGRGG